MKNNKNVEDYKAEVKRLRKFVKLSAFAIGILGILGGALLYFNGVKDWGVIWTCIGAFLCVAIPVKALKDEFREDYDTMEVAD
ncbi:hypothetical protein ACJ2A9_11800 [Anaerobacillus sp. MEB173]|uniref:hypothetical protein n=1 Tax=Anaerobacillus sp. MEB173 TaxID=3383345 RepID=UPI003F91F613